MDAFTLNEMSKLKPSIKVRSRTQDLASRNNNKVKVTITRPLIGVGNKHSFNFKTGRAKDEALTGKTT